MRGLWNAALVLAPALVSAAWVSQNLGAADVDSTEIRVPIGTTGGYSNYVDAAANLTLNIQVHPSDKPCSYENIAINGQFLDQPFDERKAGSRGSLALHDGTLKVDALWMLTCSSKPGAAVPQQELVLRLFSPESGNLDGPPMKEQRGASIGFICVVFERTARPKLLSVSVYVDKMLPEDVPAAQIAEAELKKTAEASVASSVQVEAENLDDLDGVDEDDEDNYVVVDLDDFDVAAEMEAIEQMKLIIEDLEYQINLKKRAIVLYNAAPDPDLESSNCEEVPELAPLRECDSLKCIISTMYDKARVTAQKVASTMYSKFTGDGAVVDVKVDDENGVGEAEKPPCKKPPHWKPPHWKIPHWRRPHHGNHTHHNHTCHGNHTHPHPPWRRPHHPPPFCRCPPHDGPPKEGIPSGPPRHRPWHLPSSSDPSDSPASTPLPYTFTGVPGAVTRPHITNHQQSPYTSPRVLSLLFLLSLLLSLLLLILHRLFRARSEKRHQRRDRCRSLRRSSRKAFRAWLARRVARMAAEDEEEEKAMMLAQGRREGEDEGVTGDRVSEAISEFRNAVNIVGDLVTAAEEGRGHMLAMQQQEEGGQGMPRVSVESAVSSLPEYASQFGGERLPRYVEEDDEEEGGDMGMGMVMVGERETEEVHFEGVGVGVVADGFRYMPGNDGRGYVPGMGRGTEGQASGAGSVRDVLGDVKE